MKKNATTLKVMADLPTFRWKIVHKRITTERFKAAKLLGTNITMASQWQQKTRDRLINVKYKTEYEMQTKVTWRIEATAKQRQAEQ